MIKDNLIALNKLYEVVIENLYELSKSNSGLALIKALIINRVDSDGTYFAFFRNLKAKIEDQITEIIKSKYGIYVLLTILEVSRNYLILCSIGLQKK